MRIYVYANINHKSPEGAIVLGLNSGSLGVGSFQCCLPARLEVFKGVSSIFLNSILQLTQGIMLSPEYHVRYIDKHVALKTLII